MVTLKHTWWKKPKFPVKVEIHINDDDSVWVELNGCQMNSPLVVPNWGLKDGGFPWWKK